MARIIILLIMHAFADFVLQGERLSRLKASKMISLLVHVGVYTIIFIVLSPLVLGLTFQQGLIFSLINGGVHLAIDFTTSKLKNIYWQKNESRYFAVISFDHIIHIVVLVSTYVYIYPQAITAYF